MTIIPITPLLLLIGTALLVSVLAEREQELSYYGSAGAGTMDNPSAAGAPEEEPPEEAAHQQNHPLGHKLLPFELLLPRLMALARHRFLPAGVRPFWMPGNNQGAAGEDYGGGVVMEEQEDEEGQGGVENQYNTVDKSKSSLNNNMAAVKRDRTPILSIQAPIESLRQRIQWELRKKQEERNRKILDSIKRKLHYD